MQAPELLIRGGTLCDGSGEAPRVCDVAIAEGRIVAVGDLSALEPGEVIEAGGALVTPGFVDLHTHYDLCLDWPDLSAHCLQQGVTTVVGGNCGLGSPAVTDVLTRAARAELGIHFGTLAPLGPLRETVVPRGAGRPASPAEVAQVTARVGAALDAGALGVSWGPYHGNPLMGPDELEAALTVAAARHKPFAIHRRSEGVAGLAATQEALALARTTGVRLQISHLKAAGRQSWSALEPVLEALEQVRADHDVAVDVYPYDASLTYLSAILPDALTATGRLAEELTSASGRATAQAAIARWFEERMGPEEIVLLEPSRPEIAPGSTLVSATAALGLDDPVEAVLALLEADPAATGGWAIYRTMMDPKQVELVLDLPYAAIASDAVPEEAGDGICAHPRGFSTFVRALLRAQARGPKALGEAVRRATAFPAERVGLDRGRIAVGAPADVLVLRDLAEVASYAAPRRYPRGLERVIVNGRVALVDGRPTGVRAGEVLRR